MGWVKYYGGRSSSGSRRNPLTMRAGPQTWPKRSAILPGGVGITTNMFNAVEEFLQDFRYAPNNFRYGEAALVMLLAKTTQGFAQGMARGFVTNPTDERKTAHLAWKIPVRRITSRYYQGWKVRRLAPNIWQVYNETREAYFIEFGLHPSSTRKRPRRIRTKAVIRTLQFVNQTKAAHRMLDLVLGTKGPISAQKAAAMNFGGFSDHIPNANVMTD